MNLEEAKFRDWLLSLPEGGEAGRALRPKGHPLAVWIFSLLKPGTDGALYPTRFVIVGGPQTVLPEWAVRFAKRVNDEKTPGVRVTREECLELLK